MASKLIYVVTGPNGALSAHTTEAAAQEDLATRVAQTGMRVFSIQSVWLYR